MSAALRMPATTRQMKSLLCLVFELLRSVPKKLVAIRCILSVAFTSTSFEQNRDVRDLQLV